MYRQRRQQRLPRDRHTGVRACCPTSSARSLGSPWLRAACKPLLVSRSRRRRPSSAITPGRPGVSHGARKGWVRRTSGRFACGTQTHPAKKMSTPTAVRAGLLVIDLPLQVSEVIRKFLSACFEGRYLPATADIVSDRLDCPRPEESVRTTHVGLYSTEGSKRPCGAFARRIRALPVGERRGCRRSGQGRASAFDALRAKGGQSHPAVNLRSMLSTTACMLPRVVQQAAQPGHNCTVAPPPGRSSSVHRRPGRASVLPSFTRPSPGPLMLGVAARDGGLAGGRLLRFLGRRRRRRASGVTTTESRKGIIARSLLAPTSSRGCERSSLRGGGRIQGRPASVLARSSCLA